jgi:hypothetical protein
MRGFAARALLSILAAVAIVPSAEAQSQRSCWQQAEFKRNDAFEIITNSDKTHIDIVLDADTSAEAGTEASMFTLGPAAPVRPSAAADVYLQKGTAHYEIGQVPLILTAKTLIKVASGVTLKDGKIPMNTQATIIVEEHHPISATLAQDSKLTLSTYLAVDELRLEWLPSASPAGTIKAEAFKLGAEFNQNKDKLRACILIGDTWSAASIQAIESTVGDSARLTIALPGSLSRDFTKPLLAVVLSDGKYAGTGNFRFVPTWLGTCVAIFVLLVGHVLIWRLAIREEGTKNIFREGSLGKFSQAWFASANGVPSLSMFQIYLWTWVIITGLTYVVVLTGELFAITVQVLALLGIAGLGSIAARFVAPVRGAADAARTPSFSDILKTDGTLDLFKLQMFLFTVYAAGFVAVRIAVDQAFPELDANLLLLMGISNGIYVASKVAPGESPYNEAARLDVELKVLTEAKGEADKEVDRLTRAGADLTARQMQNPDDSDLKVEIAANKEALKKAKTVADELQAKMAAAAGARKAAIDRLSK